MSRTPWFWILFVAASVTAGVFAFHFFPRAFSIISLDLKMDRAGALSSAKDLAAKHGWSPSGSFRQAATFGVDDTVKTFVELEGGGADAFRGMLAQHLYEAYTWRVRHFREGEARETLIRFTPTGTPYGFRERLKEDAPGASLPDDSARTVAEAAARDDWRVDLRRSRSSSTRRRRTPAGAPITRSSTSARAPRSARAAIASSSSWAATGSPS